MAGLSTLSQFTYLITKCLFYLAWNIDKAVSQDKTFTYYTSPVAMWRTNLKLGSVRSIIRK